MLTESEQQIIDGNKIWGFWAYLQSAFFDIYNWGRAAQSSQLLPKEELRIIYDKMYEMKVLFDIIYWADEGELLILWEERIAWLLLSEKVVKFLVLFEVFLWQANRLDQECMDFNRLLMNEYKTLIQEWNIISMAYKAKHQHSCGKILQSQQKLQLQELIDGLKTSVHDILPHQSNIPKE